MAVVVRRQYTSTTIGQYDALIASMGMQPGGPHVAPGLLFHFAVQTGDGFHVTDVWDSVAAFEEYAKDQVAPALIAIGVPAPIRIEVTEVHNYNTAHR
jgi:hypothetical protein